MAYTKHVWASGDVISSNALNEMEEGIASALPAINFNIIGGTRGQEDALDSSNTSNAETASTQYVASYVNKTIEGMSYENTNNAAATKTITSLTQSQGKINATFTEIPAATTTSKGLVQIGNNLAVADGVISADYKTEGDYNSNSNKLITNSAMSNAISTAISNIQSNISVGNNEIITGLGQVNGVVSVTSTSVPVASNSNFGFVKIGSGITINSNGEISVLTNTDGTINLDSLSREYNDLDPYQTLRNLIQNQGQIYADFQSIPDAFYTPGNTEDNIPDTYTHGLISAADLQKLYILNFNKDDDSEYFLINSKGGRKGWVRGINNFIVYDTLSIQDLEITDTNTQQSTIKPATLQIGETTLNEDQLKDLLELLNPNNN